MPLLRILVCIVALASIPAAHAQAEDTAIAGYWAVEKNFGPTQAGSIVVARRDGTWTARMGDDEASTQGEAMDLELPGGRYRGRVDADGAIRGFWIRAAATDDPRHPGALSRPYATPVVLRADGEDRWRGDVPVLVDGFRLYLKVFRDDEGRLLGAFRDPDRHEYGDAMRYLVVPREGAFDFQVPNEQDGFDTRFTATLDGDRLRVPWESFGGEVVLERRTPEQIPAFFPRPVGAPKYAYAMPDALNDGWPVARARDVGLDEAAVAAAVQGIIDEDPAARRPSLVHSLLIARRGKLVVEEYFYGFDRDTPHDTRSAGKTFASVMLGAAMREGVAISPQSRIVEVMAGRGPFANPDPRKDAITLADLMTHSAGLACNDNDEASPGNEDILSTQTAQPDLWKYTLDLPMAHAPGTRYAYCSANTNLVGGALATATKTWLPAYFERTVARPLGFGEWHWNLTDNGEGYQGGGSFLRPRDLLKVGQAFLDGGQWRGHRLVDAAWVAESTAKRIEISPQTTGYSEEDFGNYYGRGADAYAWHPGGLRVGELTFPTYAATGNGGQVLMVVPALELVVVFTGGNYRQGGIWSQWANRIVGGQVLAAPGTEL